MVSFFNLKKKKQQKKQKQQQQQQQQQFSNPGVIYQPNPHIPAPTATELTGTAAPSLTDVGTVYTSEPVTTTTHVNAQGQRIVRTVQRVPAQLVQTSVPTQVAQTASSVPTQVTTTQVPTTPVSTTTRYDARTDAQIKQTARLLPQQQPVVVPSQESTIRMEDHNSETTRHLVKQFLAEIWNNGRLDLIADTCSPDLRFNGNAGFDRIGHDGLTKMVTTIRQAVDEYRVDVHSMVVEDKKCFCRLRFSGKHAGTLLGYPATGRRLSWMGATEFTLQNDKILKVWELGDVKSLEAQIVGEEEAPEWRMVCEEIVQVCFVFVMLGNL